VWVCGWGVGGVWVWVWVCGWGVGVCVYVCVCVCVCVRLLHNGSKPAGIVCGACKPSVGTQREQSNP
jgi:hypothetical protein